jgi:hypothetical protein
LVDNRSYYKSTVIKAEWSWNRSERLETDQSIYNTWFLIKKKKALQNGLSFQ